MKFNIILFLSLTLSFCNAQIKTPAASPSSKATQTVGLTDVTVEYSRPSAKGRTIFGADGLVPFGSKWRLGANQVTTITFSDDVTLNGSKLEKGTYGVLATPEAAQWTFHFFPKESGSWSSYADKEPTLSVSSPTKAIPWDMETFTIMFGDITQDAAKLEFLWEKTYVGLDLGVEVEDRVMSNIDKVLSGPSAGDYYRAASFYHSNGKDLNQALSWIQKANEGDDKKFWQLRREALILADLGKHKEAIAAAKMSTSLAEKAGNSEYVNMNAKSIKEWMMSK